LGRTGRSSQRGADGCVPDGLGIADASIISRVTTGNTMAPRVAIGEQATAFLKPQPGEGDRLFRTYAGC
jgi:hypothetical protein